MSLEKCLAASQHGDAWHGRVEMHLAALHAHQLAHSPPPCARGRKLAFPKRDGNGWGPRRLVVPYAALEPVCTPLRACILFPFGIAVTPAHEQD